jgi:hypothetical protein
MEGVHSTLLEISLLEKSNNLKFNKILHTKNTTNILLVKIFNINLFEDTNVDTILYKPN